MSSANKIYTEAECTATELRLRELEARMRKQLLRDIANRVSPEGLTTEDINTYYCYQFKPHAYNILILRVIPRQRNGKSAPWLVLERAEGRMREALTPVFNELETAIVDGRIICIVNITTHRDSPGTEAFKLSISRFFAELSTSPDFSGFDFIMGEGVPAETAEDLNGCFLSALQSMEYGIVYGLNKKYDSYSHIQAYTNIMSILTQERKNNLQYYMDTLNREKMKELLDELFFASLDELSRSPGLAYLLPHKLLELCSAVVSERLPPSAELGSALARQRQKIDDSLTLEEIQSVTWEGILSLFNQFERDITMVTSLAVRNVKIYLRESYDRRIYLSELAGRVKLNPQYLSVLFKKETGVSITDFLTEIRIERARTLLKDTNLTVWEVAEAVGYVEARYFSRVFKARTGLRPTEYRKTAP